MLRLPRSPRSLGMLISVGKSLGSEMSVGNSLSSADSSVGRSLGRVSSVDSDESVVSVLVSAVVAVVARMLSAAVELTAADPLTVLPHAATARMVAAARARAAVTVERDLMFTPADASRTGRSIVTVRRGLACWLIPHGHWDDGIAEWAAPNRLTVDRPRRTPGPISPSAG